MYYYVTRRHLTAIPLRVAGPSLGQSAHQEIVGNGAEIIITCALKPVYLLEW